MIPASDDAPAVSSTGLFAGLWIAEDSGGAQMEIEVYDHPERGLCVWHDDYGHGEHFCGNGHIPVGASDLRFLYPANIWSSNTNTGDISRKTSDDTRGGQSDPAQP